MKQFVIAACIMYFVNGLTAVMLGPIMPQILNYYHLSYAAGGDLVLVQSLGFLIGVPLSSLLIAKFSFRAVLCTLSLCISACLFTLLCLPAIYVVGLLCALTGMSVSATESFIATMTMESFVGRRAVVMSYLEVAFGLGALVMPAIASVMVKAGLWNESFSVIGVLALVSSIIWATLKTQTEAENENSKLDAVSPAPVFQSKLTKGSVLGLLLLMIFLYVGTESSLSNFLPTVFIPYLHVPAYVASLSVATMWLAMVIGRMLTGWLIRFIPYAWFLGTCMGGALLTLAALSVSRSPVLSYPLVFILGLFLAGLYSVMLVFANHLIADSPRLVTGLVTMMSGLGGAMLPALVGSLMSYGPINIGLWAMTTFVAILFLSLLVILWVTKSAKSTRHVTRSSEL